MRDVLGECTEARRWFLSHGAHELTRWPDGEAGTQYDNVSILEQRKNRSSTDAAFNDHGWCLASTAFLRLWRTRAFWDNGTQATASTFINVAQEEQV